MGSVINRKKAWRDLAGPVGQFAEFDPETIVGLPAPARRLIERSVSPGTKLNPTVSLHMVGEIKLKKWVPFQARQILRVGEGFVWEAKAGKAPFTVRGGDTYWRGKGDLHFRLLGMIPVARASGPDIDRSAAGRLAIETVAWAPHGLTPQMGATWAGVDPNRATVSLPIRGQRLEVDVVVDQSGRLSEVSMERWGDPQSKEFALHPFGASVDEERTIGGLTIASAGCVGWWWGTERQREGEFFRYSIESGHCGSAPDEG